MNNREFGLRAEEKAAAYLTERGYAILARNYFTPYGEIDLIALDGSRVVFAEVKCRRTARCGLPREAVTARKQQRYYQAALYFLQHSAYQDSPLRFDVIEVRGEEMTVEQIQNAF